jgi:hypothetical protein
LDQSEYKNEIRKLKKNRKRYRPALKKLLKLYDQRLGHDSPYEISHPGDIALYGELLDVGYIDSDALIITTRFGDILTMVYTFRYPLSEAGTRYMDERGLHSIGEYRKQILMFAAAVLLLGCAVFFIFIL